MILNRILLSLVPALLALLLAAGVVELGTAFDSDVGITDGGPLKGRGSPNRLIAVRTIFIPGLFEDQDTEDRPSLKAPAGSGWVAEQGAGSEVAMPTSRTGPSCVWRCATPPRGPPLA
ncbi:MAG TPA: hypothetical protein VHN20_14330 [Beijerinckiaceae bacterium]|nr:hypothetical protein [Beijerinckiaceae bacterium]